MNAPLLSVRGLGVQFLGDRCVQALTDLHFELGSGQVLALLGESGCGKSVTLRTLLRLHPPNRARITGEVLIDGRDLFKLEGRELQHHRGGVVSMVFQDPGLAFDPVYTIGEQIVEVVRAHTGAGRAAARQRALAMLDRVQIPQARRRLDAYPHELSGGMRQRAMIALALCCEPRLLLADEPTTALDATVQIQILVLLRELQRDTGMSVIFVTHDIGAAAEVADRVAVMYAGRIVEENTVSGLIGAPRHPYSAGLLGATVRAAHRGRVLPTIAGGPPDLTALPRGCAFAPRCSAAAPMCGDQQPMVRREAASALSCWNPLPSTPR